MVRAILVGLVVVLGTGCAIQLGSYAGGGSDGSTGPAGEPAGDAERAGADSRCDGLTILFGDTEGGCGLSGGKISLPAAGAAVDIVKEAAAAVLTFFGKQPTEPAVVHVTVDQGDSGGE